MGSPLRTREGPFKGPSGTPNNPPETRELPRYSLHPPESRQPVYSIETCRIGTHNFMACLSRCLATCTCGRTVAERYKAGRDEAENS